jgi:hypothetical protein
MNSGAAFRPLTNGAKTRERNIIPPIQAKAARMCRAVTANQKVDIDDHVPHVNECFNERRLLVFASPSQVVHLSVAFSGTGCGGLGTPAN